MSDPRIEAISAALGGAPEDLVQRSAEARAAAQGATLDEVLGAWSGGGELASAPPPAPAEEAPAEAAAPAAEPVAEAAPEPAAAPAAVAVMEAPVVEIVEEEPVEPASLGDRVKVGARIGALIGGLLGIAAIIVTTPALLNRLALPSGEATPAVEVTPLAAILVIAGLSGGFGIILALACRGVASFMSESYRTDASPRASVIVGAMLGVVLGFVAGGILIGMAESTLTDTRLLPVRSLVFSVLLGGVVLGAVTGGVAQAIGQPASLRGEVSEDAEIVRTRLSDSMIIPLISSVIIAVIVVSLGMLLVTYPSYAPLVAILVAIGIMVFASLMASRPNLRITRGEVLLAAVGVAVVLLFLALLASETSTGHGDDEHHSIGIVTG